MTKVTTREKMIEQLKNFVRDTDNYKVNSHEKIPYEDVRFIIWFDS